MQSAEPNPVIVVPGTPRRPDWRATFVNTGSNLENNRLFFPSRHHGDFWSALGVPAPSHVWQMKEVSGNIVSDGSLTLVSVGASSPLYRRSQSGYLAADGTWNEDRGFESPGGWASVIFQAGSAGDLDTNDSVFILFVYRPSLPTSHIIGKHEISPSLQGYRAQYTTANTLTWWVATGGTYQPVNISIAENFVNIICLAFDARDRRPKAANGVGTLSQGSPLVAGATTSTEKYQLIPREKDQIIYNAYWSGADAESMIDSWSSVWDKIDNRFIPNVTVDADCAIGTKSPNGDDLAFCGPDYPRVGPHGLLVHPAATNLAINSQDFGNWNVNAVSVSLGDTDAPYGVRAGDRIAEDSATSEHYIYEGCTVANATVYVASCWAKRSSRDFSITMVLPSGTRGAIFDLAHGTVGSIEASTTADIEQYGDWYRCWIVFETGAADAGARDLRLGLAQYSGGAWTRSYAGDGSSYAWVYGAQLEQRSIHQEGPGPYVYTTGATASSLAPVYDFDAEAFVNATKTGRLGTMIKFRLDHLRSYTSGTTDIPLFSWWQDAANYLDVSLSRYYGVTYQLKVNNVTSSTFGLVSGKTYIARVQAWPNGTCRMCMSDDDRNNLCDSYSTALTYSGIVPTKLRIGCDASGANQKWLSVKEIRRA